MTFAAVARMVGESWHRVHAICARYVDLALARGRPVGRWTRVAIDETSCRRGHNYLTIAADADAARCVFVTEGQDAETIAGFAEYLGAHNGRPQQISSVSIDMSPAFIKGVHRALAQCPHHLRQVPRRRPRRPPSTRCGASNSAPTQRSKVCAGRCSRTTRLSRDQATDLDALIAQAATKRTARAWLYREQLREILDRKQINVVSAMLAQWCTNVMRSKVEPMKEVAAMIRKHFDGIVAWAQTRQTNGFIEAINGLFQAAKRKARGYTRFQTMRTVLFLIAGKLDFSAINPYAA